MRKKTILLGISVGLFAATSFYPMQARSQASSGFVLPVFRGQQIAHYLGRHYNGTSFEGTNISKEPCLFSVRYGKDSAWITGWPHFKVSFPEGGMYDHDKVTSSHQFNSSSPKRD